MKKLNNKKGFTIVELVIVIAVIGILAAVLVPTFSNVIKNAKESAAMQSAKSAYENWYADQVTKDGFDNEKINLCIVVDGYHFHVTKGVITTKANESHTDSEENMTTAYVNKATLVTAENGETEVTINYTSSTTEEDTGKTE